MLLLCGLSVLLLTAPTHAQTDFEFSLAPSAGWHFGDTRFQLDFLYHQSDSSIGSGGSELVFPLDAPRGGGQIAFRSLRNGHRVWTGNLRVLFSIADPGSLMVDEDWDNIGRVKGLWSHTESNTDASLAELDIEATRLLVCGPTVELAVVAGIGLQKFKYRMVDLAGWQYVDLDTNGQTEGYVIDTDILAGTYEIRYMRPEIGLVPRLLSGPFLVEFKAVVSPLLYAKDIDDHVLRFFQIRTDGRGFGYGGRIAVEYSSSSSNASRFFGRLSAEARTAEIDVSGHREYYARVVDGGLIIERGTRFAEQHTVKTTQYGVNLLLGLSF